LTLYKDIMISFFYVLIVGVLSIDLGHVVPGPTSDFNTILSSIIITNNTKYNKLDPDDNITAPLPSTPAHDSEEIEIHNSLDLIQTLVETSFNSIFNINLTVGFLLKLNVVRNQYFRCVEMEQLCFRCRRSY